jgi:hypothetical protein
MEFQAIFDEVFTKEEIKSVLQKLASIAQAGDLKAIKMVVDYGFFPPQPNKNGQLKLDFSDNKMILEIVESGTKN